MRNPRIYTCGAPPGHASASGGTRTPPHIPFCENSRKRSLPVMGESTGGIATPPVAIDVSPYGMGGKEVPATICPMTYGDLPHIFYPVLIGGFPRSLAGPECMTSAARCGRWLPPLALIVSTEAGSAGGFNSTAKGK